MKKLKNAIPNAVHARLVLAKMETTIPPEDRKSYDEMEEKAQRNRLDDVSEMDVYDNMIQKGKSLVVYRSSRETEDSHY